MPYLLFLKKRQHLNCRLLQIIDGAFWFKKKNILGGVQVSYPNCLK